MARVEKSKGVTKRRSQATPVEGVMGVAEVPDKVASPLLKKGTVRKTDASKASDPKQKTSSVKSTSRATNSKKKGTW